MPCVVSSSSSSSVLCPAVLGLTLGHLRAEHDVAEQARAVTSSSSVPGRSSSIGKDSTSVGPGSSIHCRCSCVHRRLVDQHDGQLGLRMNVHGGEHVPGQGGDLRLVDGDAALVVDLDAHPLCPTSTLIRARTAAAGGRAGRRGADVRAAPTRGARAP